MAMRFFPSAPVAVPVVTPWKESCMSVQGTEAPALDAADHASKALRMAVTGSPPERHAGVARESPTS
jgi:hypothetical protein